MTKIQTPVLLYNVICIYLMERFPALGEINGSQLKIGFKKKKKCKNVF